MRRGILKRGSGLILAAALTLSLASAAGASGMDSGAGGDMGSAPGDLGGDMGSAPGDLGGDMGSAPGDSGGDMGSAPGDSGGDMGSAPGDSSGDMGSAPGGDMGSAPGENMGSAPGGDMGSSGGSSSVTYTAVKEYSEDGEISAETIESSGTDENAVLVTGGEVTISDVSVTRSSSSSSGGDNASFYGVGAAILTTGGTSYISNSMIETDSNGGAGIFAYGDGVVYAADTDITTSRGASGGIHAAGGGTLYAWNLTAETAGESSAAIRSDRGGGTMVVDGGTYTSNGTGSPAIYSTADISVRNADLTANGSEAICIEGLNSISLYDCFLSGNMKDDGQNDCTWTIILYQSMSGDSEVGCSTFSMQGGTLESKNGGIFYNTNTESEFYISGVDITAADDCEFFLKVTGNSNQRGWGSKGSNGAQCIFTASEQIADGDVIWDSISSLDFYLVNGSTLTGAVLDDESNAGSGGSGQASLYIDSGSTWVVTGDSVLTNLYCEGSIVDESGNPVTVESTDGKVLSEGSSAVTVTVSDYGQSADLAQMVTGPSWDDVAVSRPAALGEAAAEEPQAVVPGTASDETQSEEETVLKETDESEEEPEEAESGIGAEETQTETSSSFVWIICIIIASLIIIAAVVIVIILAVKKKKRGNEQRVNE